MSFKRKQLIVLLLASSTFFGCTAQQKNSFNNNQNAQITEDIIARKPQISFLWMFHFNSKNNMLSQSFNDVMSDKSQNEIKTLVNRIKDFYPTKIAVERPYYTNEDLNDRYQKYLDNNYELTKEETDQIGFRLGKLLKHDSLYVVSYGGEFPIDTVINYAKSNNQLKYYEKTTRIGKQLLNKLDNTLVNGSIIQGLKYMNSDQAITMNHLTYYPLLQIGSDTNPVGIDLMSEWYKTNLVIYRNLVELVEPEDRLLVIYGQGHSKILGDLIDDNPDLELIDILKYLE